MAGFPSLMTGKASELPKTHAEVMIFELLLDDWKWQVAITPSENYTAAVWAHTWCNLTDVFEPIR